MQRTHRFAARLRLLSRLGGRPRLLRQQQDERVHLRVAPLNLPQMGIHQFHRRQSSGLDLPGHFCQGKAVWHCLHCRRRVLAS